MNLYSHYHNGNHLWCYCESMHVAHQIASYVYKEALNPVNSCTVQHDVDTSYFAKMFLDEKPRGYIDTSSVNFTLVTIHTINDYPFVEYKTRGEKINSLIN